MRQKAVVVMMLVVVAIAGAAMDSALPLHLLASALFVVAARCSICNSAGTCRTG